MVVTLHRGLKVPFHITAQLTQRAATAQRSRTHSIALGRGVQLRLPTPWLLVHIRLQMVSKLIQQSICSLFQKCQIFFYSLKWLTTRGETCNSADIIGGKAGRDQDQPVSQWLAEDHFSAYNQENPILHPNPGSKETLVQKSRPRSKKRKKGRCGKAALNLQTASAAHLKSFPALHQEVAKQFNYFLRSFIDSCIIQNHNLKSKATKC